MSSKEAGTAPGKLALWNAVVKTDPAYTKSFTRGGGFKGTAINFVYLARKATEAFGPIGIGWGARVVDDDYVPGALLESDYGSETRETIHVVRIVLWYLLDGIRGEIESYGQTTFVGKNSKGVFTDEEAPKKSMTDAMSKALSWLGFGADVHLGLFDDNKYVNDRAKEFGPGKEATIDPEHISGLEDQSSAQGAAPARAPRAPADKQAPSAIDTKKLAAGFRKAATIDELRELCTAAKAQCKVAKDAAAWSELSAVMEECREAFGATKANVTIKEAA